MRLLCALIALVLVSPPAPQPDLLQRAAQASGQPWRYHIRSRVADSQTLIDEQGNEIITRRCNGIVCSGMLVDAAGGQVSLLSYNDTPIRQSTRLDPAQITLHAIVSYAFTASDFQSAGGRVVALGPRPFGNLRVAPYAVTAPGGSRLDALLDPQTGLLAGVARDLDVIYRYEDQRRVGPLVLPFTVRRGDGSVETFADRQVVAAPLALPSGPPVTFARTSAAARLEPGALPRFACRIDGIDARCILDTGAAGLAMSLDLADRLGKKLVGETKLQGLGQVSTGVVRANSLGLGGMQIGPALFAVIPDVGGLGADVVVGSDGLARAVVRVDPGHRTIAFAPQGTALAGTSVSLRFDGSIPRVPVRLDSTAAELILDTGDDASIDLSAAFARDHSGLVQTTPAQRGILGVGGRGIVATGRIGHVEFAGADLVDVPADVNDSPQAPAPRIGAAFLTRFAFDLDYTEGRMTVRPVR